MSPKVSTKIVRKLTEHMSVATVDGSASLVLSYILSSFLPPLFPTIRCPSSHDGWHRRRVRRRRRDERCCGSVRDYFSPYKSEHHGETPWRRVKAAAKGTRRGQHNVAINGEEKQGRSLISTIQCVSPSDEARANIPHGVQRQLMER